MITENLSALVTDFSWWNVFITVKPLMLFIAGIALYAVFIFKFYRFVAKEDVFSMSMEKYKPGWEGVASEVVDVIAYVFKYFFIFPVFLFFWFLILTTLLIFLTKSQTIENIMLISVALIGAVRVTAYYDEDLSKDLAKMLPFALLGIFLVDITYFNFANSVRLALSLIDVWKTLMYYLLMIVLLEFILRIGKVIVRIFSTSTIE